MSAGRRWEATIGLEVHVQLATRTKLFCRCPVRFGAEPNTLVCPVCLGHPGVLPVPNAAALRQGARACLALGLRVNAESKFDRKNYFYPDLPKGYQISQFDEPLGSDGELVLESGHAVGIERLHLEEDAGKAVHDRGPFGLVDFNRAGTPLAEIVSRPDLRDPAEAREYLDRLKETLRWTGVSDCDMEKGNLRVDVNVSVAPPGRRATGTRNEIKNLNSFAAVEAALDHEIARQAAVLEAGGRVEQATRTWDEAALDTKVTRTKEEAEDYRYFPEPDLPRLVLDPEWIEEQRNSLPEVTAAEWRRHCLEVIGLSPNEAELWSSDARIRAYHLAVTAAGVAEAEAAKWITNEVMPRLPRGASLDDSPIAASSTAAVVRMVGEGRINRSGARKVLDRLAEEPGADPRELVTELGLDSRVDAAALEAACREAIAARPEAAADVRAGKEKALGALMGHVMQVTRGSADARQARETLLRILEE